METSYIINMFLFEYFKKILLHILSFLQSLQLENLTLHIFRVKYNETEKNGQILLLIFSQ